MAQLLLIPDPTPLDRRLGEKFSRNAPRRPGVYLMRDAQDKILYVGKAKDFKQRLGSYRSASACWMGKSVTAFLMFIMPFYSFQRSGDSWIRINNHDRQSAEYIEKMGGVSGLSEVVFVAPGRSIMKTATPQFVWFSP